MMRLAIFLAFLLVVPTVAMSQTTWYVPDDFTTIQSAIASASVVHGDTIIVRPGTYAENIDFLGKAITLRAEQGPEVTIIDGNQISSVVAFQSGEYEASVIDGFTITNGIGTKIPYAGCFGAGIYCDASCPTIMNNLIYGNECDPLDSDRGGGIYCNESAPIILGNAIFDNSVSLYGVGGGIYCQYEYAPTSASMLPVKIINNTIFRNIAGYGGGIACHETDDVVITNNTIYGNEAETRGGGLYCYSAQAIITNTIFWNNKSETEPEIGGFSPLVTYCDIKGGYAGTGNIADNPYFVNAGVGNYHTADILSFLESILDGSGLAKEPTVTERPFPKAL